MKVNSGTPYPLGASCAEGGINFAIFSSNAERIELCLFSEDGRREIARIPLPERTDDIWHGMLPDVSVGDLYGYRVYGPYDPENGHRFNHHKLLLDPYARKLYGELVDSDENLGYILGHSDIDLSFDTRDNAHNIPKCVIVDDNYHWRNDQHPRTSLAESIIYETHIKGITKQFPGLKNNKRGTYAALCNKHVLEHLHKLGCTAIELLPIHTFVKDSYLIEKGLNNYWGYNSLSFFAADRRYCDADPIDEFRKMVRCLHSQKMEVILDVVYNHTAEGNELGPTLCYRGIDNAYYYRLADNPRYYINDSGCGNTFRCSQPRVLQLIMDSLRYWVEHMHVDGFRFDLATIVAREKTGYNPRGGFLDTIMQDPVLNGTKMIAEPWDCGPGGYQLGNFPPGWSEWNDQYRDVLRKFWLDDSAQIQQLSKGLLGSSEVFEWQKRDPTASINFVTSHDGYSLVDLVSYEEKHNLANQEDNRDGHDANYSNNHGVEGQTNDTAIVELRNRQRRNILTTLFTSQGVPMLLAGDEFGHTQYGNNNAYCQDNEVTWLDWKKTESDSAHLDYCRKLIALRKEHPVLRRSRYLHGTELSAIWKQPDIQWLNSESAMMNEHDWQNPNSRFLGMLLCGESEDISEQPELDRGNEPSDDAVLVLFNASTDSVTFNLPDFAPEWRCELNSADATSATNCDNSVTGTVVCEPQSTLILIAQSHP